MDECRKRVKRALSYLGSAVGTTPRQEMQLLTALGVALYSIGPDPESNAVWTRVKGIAESLKETDYQLRAQWGLWTVCVTGGKHRAGMALARTFARLAEKSRDPEGLIVGERLVAISHHFLGEQTVARQHLEDMLNRAGPLGNRADILRFSIRPVGRGARIFREGPMAQGAGAGRPQRRALVYGRTATRQS